MSLSIGYEHVSFGIDWLTVVALDIHTAARLSTHAEQYIRGEHQRGNLQRPWGMAGFSGWACGECQYGVRNEEVIVRVSGGLAHEKWARLVAICPNVTRIDLEVTFRCEVGPRKFIRTAHRQAARHSKKLKRGPRVTLITDNEGGDTLYLGVRSSEQYARLYNKEVESKLPEYQSCVRAECEFKGDAALLVSKRVYGSTQWWAKVQGCVSGFFRTRGVDLPISAEPIINRLPRQRSDLDRRLVWLEKSVRQSVALLIESGRENEVLDALGLSHLA